MKPFLLVCLVVVFAFASAVSCARREEGVEAARDTGRTGETGSETTAPAPGTAMDQHDTEFMMRAAQACTSEINLSRLALQKSQNARVRDYAQMLIDDHMSALEKIKSAAHGANLQERADDVQTSAMERLQILSGQQFDRQYIDTIVSNQEEAVEMFRKQAASGTNVQSRQLATDLLPKLQEQLRQGQEIQKTLNSGQGR